MNKIKLTNKQKRIVKVILLVFLCIVFILVYYIINKKFLFGIPCLFRSLTGYKCAACGFTTMVFDIIDGNIFKAFLDNPLLFVLVPFITIFAIYNAYYYIQMGHLCISKKFHMSIGLSRTNFK